MADDGLLLDALKIPPEFDFTEDEKTEDILRELDVWKDASIATLRRLTELQFSRKSALSKEEKARIFFAAAPFSGTDSWTSPSHKQAADELLQCLHPVERDTISCVLEEHVKPLFLATPHPMLNLETGRQLHRPAGGHASRFDLFDTQPWKTNLGIANLLTACIHRINFSDYETLWPLLIPPIMTLLDDREGKWRLRVLSTVLHLLDTVPPELLRRTGLKNLLSTSLNNTLLFTHNPETPSLVSFGIPVVTKLILKTTRPNTEERFNELCTVLGKTVAGSLWVYSAGDLDTIRATYDGLPSIVQILGIGTVRYTKAIIPQLMSHITPQPHEKLNRALIISASRALVAVIEVCAPRMYHWRWNILDGVCKRWVIIHDDDAQRSGSSELLQSLRAVCDALEKACPAIRKEDYDRLLELDQSLFAGLFQA